VVKNNSDRRFRICWNEPLQTAYVQEPQLWNHRFTD